MNRYINNIIHNFINKNINRLINKVINNFINNHKKIHLKNGFKITKNGDFFILQSSCLDTLLITFYIQDVYKFEL